MAAVLFILLAVCCVPVLSAMEDLPLAEDEMLAIQDRLALLEGLEKTYKSLAAPEEDREDKCLPEGAGCSFSSGPGCCGVRMRCIVWDHYTSGKGGNKWHSACREYKAGVAIDEITKFFQRLG